MIGIFNDNFPPILDGVAMTAKNYADWLSWKGQDVCVVTPWAPQFPKELHYPLYSYMSVPIPGRPPYRYDLPHLDRHFQHTYRQLHFDLIHAHCPFTTGHLALHTGKKQHIPVVATFHSKYRQDFEHAISNKTLIDYAIKRIVEFYEAADEVWIPQAAVEPTLREYGYKGRVEVVDNGNDFVTPEPIIKDIRKQMRQELGLNRDQTMLLYVGQITWEKNIQFTLNALNSIKYLPFHLYIIGTGYAESHVRRIIKETGLSSKVSLLGLIKDRAKLRSYYAASDIFLFPSEYDTFGLVAREAAALHTPSIMLKGSMASADIRDRANGFITNNNTSDYASLIRYLIEHPQLVRQCGEEASHTLVRSWESVVEEAIERYHEIIKKYKVNNK